MQQPTPAGLPPRIYLPIVAVLAAAFLGVVGYFVSTGFGVNGSLFGRAGSSPVRMQASQESQNAVEGGGPPPAIMLQVRTLRARIAAHPNDDVSLTQLGDMFLASNQFAQAVPLYRRALHANPHNIAAKTGLDEAQTALRRQ